MGTKRLDVCQLINHSFVSTVFAFIVITSIHSSLAKGQAGLHLGRIMYCGSVLLVHVLVLQTSYNSI